MLQIHFLLFLLPVLSTAPQPLQTVPAFPEQSDLASCPLDMPDELFHAVSRACSAREPLSRSRCCPVLATWLYSAYSGTALGKVGKLPAPPFDLPVMPDDSETCVGSVEKAMSKRGVEMPRLNGTCDLAYCYCGIRLHVPTCTDSFRVSTDGRLVGDVKVRRLERECASSTLGGCNNCLKALHQLNSGEEKLNGSYESDRRNKMHGSDCMLMGLTWLLSKNRSAYIPTVSAVVRAIMMNGRDGSNLPPSCVADRDRMPLAVDSAELHDPSSSTTIKISFFDLLVLLSGGWFCIACLCLGQSNLHVL